jgi:hypothetical protein
LKKQPCDNQRYNIIKTITISKHLGNDINRQKITICFDFQLIITNDEKDIMFMAKLKLFFVGTIVQLEKLMMFFIIYSIIGIATNMEKLQVMN